ncbi:hypothetical protein OVA14_10585 [Agrococcus sp. SL85]|uniref:hypothetical protein n=1 Tax=Agrococcus sp. SL85 TaxID=2995141 RepID=UPI00226D275A|nr:hypothetical protein [Agrococcus sp. SL85]WAC65764.1 hypothetical protein OVA14_10585 [Agrococcus sp. SL85]
MADMVPGLTTGNLAQLRYAGGGPVYSAVTRKTIVYELTDVVMWIESKRRARTDQPLPARTLALPPSTAPAGAEEGLASRWV